MIVTLPVGGCEDDDDLRVERCEAARLKVGTGVEHQAIDPGIREAWSDISVRSRPSASVLPEPNACHSPSPVLRSSTTPTPPAGRP